VVGFGVGFVLGLMGPVGVAIGVGLLLYSVYETAANWDKIMAAPPEKKAEMLGNLAGGILGGGMGAKAGLGLRTRLGTFGEPPAGVGEPGKGGNATESDGTAGDEADTGTPRTEPTELQKQQLQDAINKAENNPRTSRLSEADRDWLDQDARNKELAADPDTGSYKVGEAKAALQAEDDGTLPGPVRRAIGDGEQGADYVDGEGTQWDVKDARAGADVIQAKAGAGENILVDTSNVSPAQEDALRNSLQSLPEGSGQVKFVRTQ